MRAPGPGVAAVGVTSARATLRLHQSTALAQPSSELFGQHYVLTWCSQGPSEGLRAQGMHTGLPSQIEGEKQTGKTKHRKGT